MRPRRQNPAKIARIDSILVGELNHDCSSWYKKNKKFFTPSLLISSCYAATERQTWLSFRQHFRRTYSEIKIFTQLLSVLNSQIWPYIPKNLMSLKLLQEIPWNPCKRVALITVLPTFLVFVIWIRLCYISEILITRHCCETISCANFRSSDLVWNFAFKPIHFQDRVRCVSIATSAAITLNCDICCT